MDSFSSLILPDDTPEDWARRRERIRNRVLSYFGTRNESVEKVAPEPVWGPVEKCDGCTRRHVTYQLEPGQRGYAFVYIPDNLGAPAPVAMCYHGTSQIGKDAVSG